LSELKSLVHRLTNYVKHDSETLMAIQRLDEVHRSALDVRSNDFQRWFAVYDKDSSCSFLTEMDTFAMRVLNYLGRATRDKRGSLLLSTKPMAELERPDVKDQFAPHELELWMKEYTSEFHYLMKLAKFGISLNMIRHVKGYQKKELSFDLYFKNLHPRQDYEDANKRYLEGLDFIDSHPKLQKCKPCGIKGENIFSFCKKDEMSRTYCTNCHKHYHYLPHIQDCVPNTCTCLNGQAKEFCERHGVSSCRNCNPGYHPEGYKCRKARCVCSYGTPVSESSCPREKANKCNRCNTHYKLVNHHCVWKYKCTCLNGTPKSGRGQCFGGENCNSCRSGFVRLRTFCTKHYNFKVLRSGDTIGLKANCGSSNRWLSNYCTVNCGRHSSIQSCPGTHFGTAAGRCGGEKLSIVAEGKALGEAINFGDVVGLYYGAGHWMSCEGVNKNCRTRTCPGSIHHAKYLTRWKWGNACGWEKFQIQSSKWLRYTAVVQDWSAVSIVRLGTHNGWISRDGNDVNLRTCPGNDGKGWLTHNCGCERWTLDII